MGEFTRWEKFKMWLEWLMLCKIKNRHLYVDWDETDICMLCGIERTKR